ncbi:hypothetical protein [Nocardioides sp.]
MGDLATARAELEAAMAAAVEQQRLGDRLRAVDTERAEREEARS